MRTFKQLTQDKIVLRETQHKKCLEEFQTAYKKYDGVFGLEKNLEIHDYDKFKWLVTKNLYWINRRWIHPTLFSGDTYEETRNSLKSIYKNLFYEIWLIIRLWLPDNFGFITDNSRVIQKDIDTLLQGNFLKEIP